MSRWGGRVIVGVSGSVGSLQALRRAVAEARLRDAELWSVLAWVPQGGEYVNRRSPDPYLLDLWERNAFDRLRVAWDEATGGIPVDLTPRILAGRGFAGELLVRCAREDDLIVVGTGSTNPVRRALGGSVAGYCARRARCAVLTVPPSPLQAQMGRGTLTGYLTRRKTVRDLTRCTDVTADD
jgi:nucleotide-binding universal stress UspA family protein